MLDLNASKGAKESRESHNEGLEDGANALAEDLDDLYISESTVDTCRLTRRSPYVVTEPCLRMLQCRLACMHELRARCFSGAATVDLEGIYSGFSLSSWPISLSSETQTVEHITFRSYCLVPHIQHG